MEDLLQITITAIDDGFVMGDDMELTLKPSQTIRELAIIINNKKGISPRRMSFVVPPKRLIPVEKWGKSISSCGIYSGTKIKLHPTFPGCWRWESQEYYVKQSLDNIMNVIKEENSRDTDEEGVLLEVIDEKVTFPPTLKREELLSFIRQYPEIFYVEVNTSLEETRVNLNTAGKLPIWL